MKILVAVDGSPISTKAVKFAIKLGGELAQPAELTLFHADPPLLNAVAVKLGPAALKRYHDENGKFATKHARAALNRAQIAFEETLVVDEPARAIVKHAEKGRYDLIVMGSRGHGALSNLLLGSVTSKVIAGCAIPVTVAR